MDAILGKLNAKYSTTHRGGYLKLSGELCPFCRRVMAELMRHYGGDWRQAARTGPAWLKNLFVRA